MKKVLETTSNADLPVYNLADPQFNMTRLEVDVTYAALKQLADKWFAQGNDGSDAHKLAPVAENLAQMFKDHRDRLDKTYG